MSTETSPQVFTDVSLDPFVRGLLHRPVNPNGSGVVLTHGAGSNCQAPLLIAVAETFAAAGFTVLRCDLPYRQGRPYGPPGPGDAKRDRAGDRNSNSFGTLVHELDSVSGELLLQVLQLRKEVGAGGAGCFGLVR